MFPFALPFLGRPVLWYGFFFALGFFLGYFALVALLRRLPFLPPGRAVRIADQVTLYVAAGAVLGARLGDVLFYQDWANYARDPWTLLRVWEGGLASHGGAFGVLAALFCVRLRRRKRDPQLSFLRLLDVTVIPAALAGSMIRIGNFFNQEILGTPSSLPWAVIFGHPIDGSAPSPRHPVQLYESLYYLALFFVLFALWMRSTRARRPGTASGLFLVAVFSFRFLVEFVKVEQSVRVGPDAWLTMGQLLSMPFILLGVALLLGRRKWR
jgi:prolipoprotein diacylglyceryl transferase